MKIELSTPQGALTSGELLSDQKDKVIETFANLTSGKGEADTMDFPLESGAIAVIGRDMLRQSILILHGV